MYVTGNEVVALSGVVLHIEITILDSGACLVVIGKDSCCLVAVEESHGLADGCEDVVVAIDRCGIVTVWQFLHLVAVVANCCTKLDVPQA